MRGLHGKGTQQCPVPFSLRQCVPHQGHTHYVITPAHVLVTRPLSSYRTMSCMLILTHCYTTQPLGQPLGIVGTLFIRGECCTLTHMRTQ